MRERGRLFLKRPLLHSSSSPPTAPERCHPGARYWAGRLKRPEGSLSGLRSAMAFPYPYTHTHIPTNPEVLLVQLVVDSGTSYSTAVLGVGQVTLRPQQCRWALEKRKRRKRGKRGGLKEWRREEVCTSGRVTNTALN